MLESFKKNGDVLCENRSAGKKLALTFDDGPDPVYTEQILDILAEYSVKATFFMIGKKYREISRYRKACPSPKGTRPRTTPIHTAK